MVVRERLSERQLATSTPSMQEAIETLLLAARSMAPILIRAEIGSEVGALARLAHDNSPCRGHRFVSLCCPSIGDLPADALARAEGGTLFLDQVSDLGGRLQKKLAYALDDLSSSGDAARVISSTTRDLAAEVRKGAFREDLFFRLNVIDIRVPPLRERREDIVFLARRLIASLSADLGRRAPSLSDGAAAVLERHTWPANLLELRNVLERALFTCPADVLEREAFAEIDMAASPDRDGVGDDITLRDLERAHITRVMARVPSYKDAAAILGIDEATLWRRRRRYAREAGTPIGPRRAR